MSKTYEAEKPQCPFRRYDRSVWNSRDVRAAEVLQLAAGRHAGATRCDGHVVGRHGDVGNRIVHAVVEKRPAHRDTLRRRDADADLLTGQPLRAQRLVRERQHLADAERAVELFERRRAETLAEAAPHREAIGRAIERGESRADGRVGFVGQRLAMRRRRLTCRDHRLEVVGIVVAPAVDAGAQRHLQLRRHFDQILPEHAHEPLRASSDAMDERRRPVGSA